MKQLIEKISAFKVGSLVEAAKEFDKKTWLFIGLGIAGFLIFVIFIFYPGWIERPALKKQTAEAVAQMARLQSLNAKKPQLENQKKEIQELMNGFQNKLFTEEETAFLLGRISKIAADAQVELQTSKPVDNVESFPEPYSKKYKKTVYQLSVEGSYHRIADFVSLLESYAQYFQIQSLSITPQATKTGEHIGDINLMAVSHTADQSKV